MNLAVNRILHGGAWDEIDKTMLSFKENDEKLINGLFLRIFYFTRAKFGISGEHGILDRILE